VAVIIEETHVHVAGDDDALDKCLERHISLSDRSASIHPDYYIPLTIEPRGVARLGSFGAPGEAVRSYHMLAFGTARTGDTRSPGVAARGAVDLLHFGEVWLTSAFEGELSDGKLSVARAAIGLDFTPSARAAAIGFYAGWGRTQFGDAAPLATEFAIEMRGSAHSKNAAVLGWFRMSRLLASTNASRAHADGDPLRPDEVSAGLGTSVPVFGLHVYAGFAYEHRTGNDDVVFEFGVPIIDHF
jgi:hypothetical protein